MSGWTVHDIPDQSGRRAVITGATGGLGYETALALAGAGAEVILTGRSEAKGRAAQDRIKTIHPAARIRFELLDLASLGLVADFAQKMAGEDRPIDLLVNNAGVMALPKRQVTDDGFELQLGTNYLGHFALTGRLLPLLTRAAHPRVVSLSSVAAQQGAIDFDDLQSARSYAPWKAYAQTKLAMLMFAVELQRRSAANGWGLTSNAAHPGWARTDLVANGPAADGQPLGVWRLAALVAPLLSQSAADGALPILLAATAPPDKGGAYYGPAGFRGLKGPPVPGRVPPRARDEAAAARLWDRSAALTGVTYTAVSGEAADRKPLG